MRRLKYFVPLAATVVLLSACGDQPLAPSAQTIKPHADVIIDSVVTNGSDMDVDFTVTSTGGWFLVGPHKLYFPANSICDPSVSTYGPTEWDQPCTAATAPVKIRASVRTAENGQPMVEFTPALRFVPDSTNWVYLFFFTDEAKQPMTDEEIQAKFNILWSPTLGQTVVDESIFDATQKTYVIRSEE